MAEKKEYLERERLIKLIYENTIKFNTTCDRKNFIALDQSQVMYLLHSARPDFTGNLGYIDVAPERHGKWNRGKYMYSWECDQCGKKVYSPRKSTLNDYKYPYCPNCGAKMDKE